MTSSVDRGRAAGLIVEFRETVIAAWRDRVRSRIRDSRKEPGLLQALPALLDKLAEELGDHAGGTPPRRAESPVLSGEPSLPQTLNELRMLRETLVDFLDADGLLHADARQQLHRFIDQQVLTAALTQSHAAEGPAAGVATSPILEEQLAIAVSRVGFYDWDIVANVITFSERMQQDWGFGAATTLEEASRLIHPDDQPRVAALIQSAVGNRTPYYAQYRMIRPRDGRELWIEAHGQVTYAENGKPIRFFGTSVDISDRKAAELRLRQSEQRYRAAYEASPQMLWVFDPQGNLLSLSRCWTEFTGRSSEDTRRLGYEDLIHPADYRPTRDLLLESMATGKDYHCELRIRRASDGEYIWHESHGRPHRAPDGTISEWVGVTHDIHFQKLLIAQSEAELTKSIAQANRYREQRDRFLLEAGRTGPPRECPSSDLAEEREIRERFVSALSHDLRTPIAAALLSSQLIQRQTGSGRIHDLAVRVQGSMERADRMICDLLDANRIKAGESLSIQVEACRIDQIVEAAAREADGTERRAIAVRNEAGPVAAVADPIAVRRALENLIGNAVKYGSPGQLITLRLSRAGATARISVHNHGETIAAADLAGLFDPWRRIDPSPQSGSRGWGIGLILVRGIAEAHGGSVSVASAVGSGTTFTIELPIAPVVRDL